MTKNSFIGTKRFLPLGPGLIKLIVPRPKRFAQRQQKQMAGNLFGALSEALRSQPPAVFILDSEKREALHSE